MNNVETFGDLLECLHVERGDLVYVHSSFSRMKMFDLSAHQIIEEIVDKVGAAGTVVFPCFCFNVEPAGRPWKGYEKYFFSDIYFDVQKTKSNMGYLSEVFRRRKGVLRSTHPFWSVSAAGPLAGRLVANQESVEHPYGPLSSFGMMRDNNVKLVGFGVTLNTTSLCPLVDYDLGADHTQKVFTDRKIKAKVVNGEREEMECLTHTMLPEAVRDIRPIKVFENCEELKNTMNFIEQDGSYFFSYYFKDFYNAAMKLGRKSVEAGGKMPWLELLPVKNRG